MEIKKALEELDRMIRETTNEAVITNDAYYDACDDEEESELYDQKRDLEDRLHALGKATSVLRNADRYRWHDKSEGLPDYDEEEILLTVDELGRYRLIKRWAISHAMDVTAWRYIEPFEVEE